MGCGSSKSEEIVDPDHVNVTHFEKLRVMGKGGFGKVYLCRNKANDQMMAMKVMKKRSLIKHSVNVTSLWIERNVLARLTGPYCAHLFYAFQDADDIYLIMNFLPGGDFRYVLFSWFLSLFLLLLAAVRWVELMFLITSCLSSSFFCLLYMLQLVHEVDQRHHVRAGLSVLYRRDRHRTRRTAQLG